MHFIITGGAGFIGSHLVELLLAQGHRVTVVDNLSTGCRGNLPSHPRLQFLLRDVSSCTAQDFIGPIDGVAHLAATPSVADSWAHPLATHQNNLSATVAVLELCQALQIPRLVFTSSAAVYGDRIQLPIREEQDTVPISPYGLQKLVGEQYGYLLSQQSQLSFVALRLFNVFGPRQLPDSPYSGVISIFKNAMENHQPITIFGDGSQSRDFVYVKDVAMAFAKALTQPMQPQQCLTCNVGTGKAISLLELVEVLQSAYPQWSQALSFAEARAGDIKQSQAAIEKARSLLDFVPQWTIEAGMRDFLQASLLAV